jgi:CheY-like chemotaxis protein
LLSVECSDADKRARVMLIKRILAVEDNDQKFEQVATIIQDAMPLAILTRAADLFEAERAIEQDHWDLLLLDMTLDLKRGGARRQGTAQDYTGGLKIIGQMYYNGDILPTIIVTAFDSFPAPRNDGNGVVIGLEAVEREAKRRLGNRLIGIIRFGPDQWEAKLRELLIQAETNSI